MHRHSPRRSIFVVLALAALVAILAGGTARAANRPTIGGTWTGRYGGAFTGTFTIHWKLSGSKLSGTIALSRPKGTYGITGSVVRGKIRFGAVDVGARYTGTVSGNSMSGTYTTPNGGGPWSAHKRT